MPTTITIFVVLAAVVTPDGQLVTGHSEPMPDRVTCERVAEQERVKLRQQQMLAMHIACAPLVVPKSRPQPQKQPLIGASGMV